MKTKLKESSEVSENVESKYESLLEILSSFNKFKLFPLILGTIVAVILNLIGRVMPPVPGAITMVVGIAIFIFGGIYTIIQSIINSSKNVKEEYKAARRHDNDAY